MKHEKNNIFEMRRLLNEMSFKNIESTKFSKYDFRVHHSTVTYDNPISLYFSKHGFDENSLEEGLIKTYPIDKTIEYVKSYFQLSSNNVLKKETNNGKEHILVTIPDIGINIKIMNKALDVCGYYFGTIASKNKINNISWVTLQYEAKIQNNDSTIIRDEETHLYHLTPKYNENKILKNGFAPLCKNDVFKYPNRIYFIRGSINEESILNLCEQLCYYNNSIGNNGLYTIFDINLKLIPDDIKLFNDPNYPKGVFTTENIKPNCITKIGHINFMSQHPNIIWDNKKIKSHYEIRKKIIYCKCNTKN